MRCKCVNDCVNGVQIANFLMSHFKLPYTCKMSPIIKGHFVEKDFRVLYGV